MGYSKVRGAHHTISNDVYILKVWYRYFSQRYSIFSWYDEGVYLTDDAWFGVTPEPVAKYVPYHDFLP